MELEAHQQQQRQQELKHVCKFCGKSFACGRSLGGHMRSHMINDISALADGTKLTKKKLPPLATYLLSNSNSDSVNNSKNINSISPGTPGYILRENPKRTWKFSDHHHNSSEDDNNNNTNSPFLDNSCKESGKVFQSWKALFGHMKSHSTEKERVSNNNIEEETHEEQQGSWTTNNNNSSSNNNNNNRNNNQKLVMDSQSDNETATPSKRKRSKRRTRYKGAANSSSLSFPNNASSSVSEIEQEQEDVAMCLIMLSRDVGQLGGFNTLAVESSDNNSVSLGTNPARAKSTEGKNFACKVKVTSLGDKKLDEDSKLGDTKAEFSASGIPRKECTKNDHSEFENSGVEFGKNFKKESELDEADEVLPDKCNDFSSKRKSIDSFDREMKSDSLKKFKALDAEGSSKFECTTCNKVFHSYHALGGHRASHKKIKGCFASKIDNSENSIEIESSPDQQLSDRNKLIIPTINEIPTDQLAIDPDEKAETSNGAKKSKGHECPICLKVFPSGQALGGHKRAHLIAGAEAKGNQAVAAQEPIPVIRDFLDLNLPAPVEEESNGPLGFNPWWIASSHKHEPLIGLISN